MDNGLFGKYANVLVERKNKINEIIDFITQETNIVLYKEEIIIKKNIISFQTSSVKKVLLRKKSIEEFLERKGLQIRH